MIITWPINMLLVEQQENKSCKVQISHNPEYWYSNCWITKCQGFAYISESLGALNKWGREEAWAGRLSLGDYLQLCNLDLPIIPVCCNFSIFPFSKSKKRTFTTERHTIDWQPNSTLLQLCWTGQGSCLEIYSVQSMLWFILKANTEGRDDTHPYQWKIFCFITQVCKH